MAAYAQGEGKLRRLTRHLMVWYDASQRQLPWRQTRDPYPIWISEVMLQQTMVKTVLPYYRAFLEAFPTLKDLADADPEAVLARWSGLGYYRRARLLHAAAREVQEHYGGRVPRDPERFRSLPGVGAYTTAAVLSVAYDVPLAVVDGNVARVLSRLFGLPERLGKASTTRQLSELAARLLPPRCPGRFNQAMMELGATVCLPRAPRCEECPVTASCVAEHDRLTEVLPTPARRPPSRPVSLAAVVVRSGGRLLLTRRAAEPGARTLLVGLWGLPMLEASGSKAARALETLLGKLGLVTEVGAEMASVRHSITRHRIRLGVHEASVPEGVAAPPECLWVRPEELDSYGLPSLYTKALRSLV